ncbi:MAG TPA: hypothetical protein VGM41_01995 [Chitinophagaceae bacterium]
MQLVKGYQFWKWFAVNQSSYFDIDEKEHDEVQYLFRELLQQLHDYCNKLVFQIGGKDPHVKELIISAEGNAEYFDKAEHLVQMAPQLKRWKFIALAPPTESLSAIEYDGLQVDPHDVWFAPIETREEPHLLGVRICIDGFSATDEHRYYSVAYVLLEAVLGERSTALDVHYLEVATLPSNPEKDELFPVETLPAYIEMRRSQAVLN